MWPEEVREQMLLRLDEIREYFQAFKADVISHSINKTWQSSERQGATCGPMDTISMDRNGEQEEVEAVDEVRKSQRCFTCGTVGHFVRDSRWESKSEDKGREGRRNERRRQGRRSQGRRRMR